MLSCCCYIMQRIIVDDKDKTRTNITMLPCTHIWRSFKIFKVLLPQRYCPPGTARFIPTNKISPKFKQVHEGFLSPKLFSAKVKRLFVISLSLMEPEKASTRMKTKKTKMLMSFKHTFCNKNRQTRKFVLNLKIWNLNLKCNQSNDCIFCIYPIRI